MDENRLLASVADAYASLSSYIDEGVVNTTLRMPEASFQHAKKFSTAYVKPNLFRFKLESPHPYPPLAHFITTYICGFDGTSAYLWTQHHDQPAEVCIETQFDMAVAGATGISGGSVRTIASLFFREVGGVRITDFTSAVMADDEDFEGTRCHVVSAQNPRGYVQSLWIDHTTLTIRKTARGGQYPSEEIRRNIRLNEPIDAQIFARPEGVTERSTRPGAM